MPAIARLGDIGSGHGGWPPRVNDQASSNVLANSLGIHRKGDHWINHTNPTIPETHDSNLASGSSTVFINSLDCGRVGDPIACGSTVASGSPDCFAGG